MIDVKLTNEHKHLDGSVRHGTIMLDGLEYDICKAPSGRAFICRSDDNHDHEWVRQCLLEFGDWC